MRFIKEINFSVNDESKKSGPFLKKKFTEVELKYNSVTGILIVSSNNEVQFNQVCNIIYLMEKLI